MEVQVDRLIHKPALFYCFFLFFSSFLILRRCIRLLPIQAVRRRRLRRQLRDVWPRDIVRRMASQCTCYSSRATLLRDYHAGTRRQLDRSRWLTIVEAWMEGASGHCAQQVAQVPNMRLRGSGMMMPVAKGARPMDRCVYVQTQGRVREICAPSAQVHWPSVGQACCCLTCR